MFFILVEVMDVRDMKYDEQSFDFVIDKSTIDALLCGENSFLNVAIMLKEVQRVLKDEGFYMIISYGKPENRIPHLERAHLDFEISVYTIKKDIEESPDLSKLHYVYVCKKNKNANLKSEKNFDFVCYEIEQQEMMDREIYADENEDDDYDYKDYESDDDALEYNDIKDLKDYKDIKDLKDYKDYKDYLDAQGITDNFDEININKKESKDNKEEKILKKLIGKEHDENFNEKFALSDFDDFKKAKDIKDIEEILNRPLSKENNKSQLPSLNKIN